MRGVSPIDLTFSLNDFSMCWQQLIARNPIPISRVLVIMSFHGDPILYSWLAPFVKYSHTYCIEWTSIQQALKLKSRWKGESVWRTSANDGFNLHPVSFKGDQGDRVNAIEFLIKCRGQVGKKRLDCYQYSNVSHISYRWQGLLRFIRYCVNEWRDRYEWSTTQ